MDRSGLETLLEELGEPAYRGRQVHAWLVRGIDDPAEMTDVPSALRPELAARFLPARPELVSHVVTDEGRTHKLLLRFDDGEAIETVLMLYPGRATVCVSSQAGCALGCPFCATGQAGLRRQLISGEIVRQVVVADAALRTGRLFDQDLPEVGRADRVTNVVFMGMGEPLANLDATIAAIEWLHDPEGFDLGARSITVSTVGLVPGMRRLADLGIPVTLAVSLHAANDRLRDDLVPINRTHPIAEVIDAARAYRAATNRRVTFEWCLIGDVNDSIRDAHELAELARSLRAHVNVIPMNPTPGVVWREPSLARTEAFIGELERRGVNVTLRDTRGRDADAACGQLLARYHLGDGRRLPVAVGAAERVDAWRTDATDVAPT
ncbi:MAG: 23S rRNA (adenine(2503)-C(2))-methyltransferase RlmN [Actinobacteria bacterium]|nr:23S rRNA (adenine(2503)-C(2))-methyltransferase RlmN [Actinomycetota bacterium]